MGPHLFFRMVSRLVTIIRDFFAAHPFAAALVMGVFLRCLVIFVLFQVGYRYQQYPHEYDFEKWCLWDCRHYATLAITYIPELSTFFPGWPLLVTGFQYVLPFLTEKAATIILSNIIAILATGMITWLAAMVLTDLDNKENSDARKGWPLSAFAVSLVMNINPLGQFWSQGYSEPLFAAVLAALFILFYKKMWMYAAITASFLAIIRPQGVWIAALFGMFM